jgi:FkbM family methyltransferase
MPTFYERYGHLPLREVFADATRVSALDPELQWLAMPPPDFLQYVRSAPRRPYDGVPPDPDVFRTDVSFLIAQAHRIWLTLDLLAPFLGKSPEFVTLDVGAYPFAIAEAIRCYLKSDCRLIATLAQRLSADAVECLAALRIELLPVNLDPRVKVTDPLPGMTDYLPLPDNSVDLVIFAHVIEHLYHPIQILRELVRVLKPDGKLVLTTDNGLLLGGFLNYLHCGRYLYEPVEGTAAMVFHEWRGHVRFYTEGDVRGLLEAAGAEVLECRFREVLYNSVPEEYFVEPNTRLPRWRIDLLREIPQCRNELMMIATKRPRPPVSNPLDPQRNAPELTRLSDDFAAMRNDLDRATLLDVVFGYRLFCGRWPTPAELAAHAQSLQPRGVDRLVDILLRSPEFRGRTTAVHLERPGPSCIVMAETEEGLRFFFSVQDTFVGFPVAVGVYEPEVRLALDRLLRPGMNCIDVGANFGYHSIRMAQVVARKGGKVYAFEPEPFSYHLLLKNIAENRLEHGIVPHRIACGDRDGEAFLYRDPNPANFGGAAVLPGQDPSLRERLVGRVPLRRLDSLFSDDRPIHLVKIDVEGYEFCVLRGMERILRFWSPTLILAFNSTALGWHGVNTASTLLAYLRDFDYGVYEAASFAAGEPASFEYRPGEWQFANLICVPRSAQAHRTPAPLSPGSPAAP